MNLSEHLSQQEKLKVNISSFPLEGTDEDLQKLKDATQELRTQMNDEDDYTKLAFVFGGSFNTGYKGKFFVADVDRVIVGIAVASVDDNNVGKLKAIFVPKKFRKRGIGLKLTEERMKYLIENNVKKIQIDVTSQSSLSMATALQAQYPDLVEYTDHGDYVSFI